MHPATERTMSDDCNTSFIPASPADDPEMRRNIAKNEREIEKLKAEQELVEAKAKDLIEREVAGEGPFAGEIYQLKQRKMEIVTEVQTLRARINRALLGME